MDVEAKADEDGGEEQKKNLKHVPRLVKMPKPSVLRRTLRVTIHSTI